MKKTKTNKKRENEKTQVSSAVFEDYTLKEKKEVLPEEIQFAFEESGITKIQHHGVVGSDFEVKKFGQGRQEIRENRELSQRMER